MDRLKGILCIFLLAANSTASAIPLSTTGGADSLAEGRNIGASDADQLAFIADYLNVDASTLNLAKRSNSGGSDGLWQSVEGDPSLWAFDLGGEMLPLFLIKTGGNIGLAGDGSPNTFNTYLFLNDGSGGTLADSFAVIDLDLFEKMVGSGVVGIGMVSHLSVPEPGTLILLGSGLLGFGLQRMRRRKA